MTLLSAGLEIVDTSSVTWESSRLIMRFCCLQVSLVVDDAHVDCDSGPINFKPTVMFQTRVFTFSLKNTGLGNVNYKWAVQTLDGTSDTSGMYSVRTQSRYHLLSAASIPSRHKLHQQQEWITCTVSRTQHPLHAAAH